MKRGSMMLNCDTDYTKADNKWIDEILECPVFYPSKRDFDDPFPFLQNVALQASKYGICKIVSPVQASVGADIVLTEEIKDFKFETTVQPLRLGTWDSKDKITFFRRGRKFKYREFESMANKVFNRHFSGRISSLAQVEKEFWCQIANRRKTTVEYGINVEGSAFSSDPNDHFANCKWNLKHLSRLPESSLRFLEGAIPGITDPMLYIGMLFSMFAWHVEDHNLFSINYHHLGAPKTWYSVPADSSLQFEKVVCNKVYKHDILSEDSEDGASKLLAQKTTMFPPKILLHNNVPVYKALQNPGEFVITLPKAYHAGFSHGFNCGEAMNFAMSDWFRFGEEARQRYASLSIVPIIPFEELLCKEAMLLYQHLNNKGSVYSVADLRAYFSVKPCFTRLVKFYEQALRLLGCVSGSSSAYCPTLQGTIICSICKRDCYLAYMSCNCCYSYSICLYHVLDSETKLDDCPCGSKPTVLVREDMTTYIVAAQKFEQLLVEAEQETKTSLVDDENAMSTCNLKNDTKCIISSTAYLAGKGRRRKGKSNMTSAVKKEVIVTKTRRMKGFSQTHSRL